MFYIDCTAEIKYSLRNLSIALFDLCLLSIVHNVTTVFAWIHHLPYMFANLFPFALADNVSH